MAGRDLEPIGTEAPAAPTAGRGRGYLGWAVAGGAALAVAIVLGIAIAGGGDDGERSPRQVLEDVRRFVAAQDTAHLEVESLLVVDGPEQRSETRLVSGEVVLPNLGHWRISSFPTNIEILATQKGTWQRDGDVAWSYAARVVEAATDGWFGHLPGDPATLISPWSPAHGPTSLLDERLRIAEQLSVGTIRARSDMANLAAVLAPRENDTALSLTGTVEITSAPNGRLDRMVWRIEAVRPAPDDQGEPSPSDFERSNATIDMRFTRWGTEVDMAPPPISDVDLTPRIDEPGLQDSPLAARLLVPRRLPEDSVLTSAGVGFNGGCDSDVNLSWAGPAGFALWLHAAPATCPQDPTLATPGASTVSVVVDGARHTFTSTLPQAQLDGLAADLVPFNLAEQPIAREPPPG